MPSISISLPNDTYQLLIEYRNKKANMSQSHAGAELIKMGFAWDIQTEEFLKEQKQIRVEREAIKAASVEGITEAVKTAQKPKERIKLKV